MAALAEDNTFDFIRSKNGTTFVMETKNLGGGNNTSGTAYYHVKEAFPGGYITGERVPISNGGFPTFAVIDLETMVLMKKEWSATPSTIRSYINANF